MDLNISLTEKKKMPSIVKKRTFNNYSVECVGSAQIEHVNNGGSGVNLEEFHHTEPGESGDENDQRQQNEMVPQNLNREKRQRRERELRERTRQAYTQLRKFLNEVESDLPTVLHGGKDVDNGERLHHLNEYIPHSNLNTLIKTNNALFAMVEINRELKREKLRLRKKLRKRRMLERKRLNNKNIVTLISPKALMRVTETQQANMTHQNQKQVFYHPFPVQTYPSESGLFVS